MIKIFMLSKKIHRILVVPFLFLGGIMTITGVILDEPEWFSKYLDTGLVRYIHGRMSIIFAGFVLFMMFTGTMLYFFPLLRFIFPGKKPPTPVTPTPTPPPAPASKPLPPPAALDPTPQTPHPQQIPPITTTPHLSDSPFYPPDSPIK